MNIQQADILIVGTGAAGLYAALHVDEDKKVLMITKDEVDRSDSYLAQGGMCMLPDEADFDDYFEDTLKAGHYENDRESVEIMIRASREIAQSLEEYGVEFEKENGKYIFTREGGHSRPRILFHKDETGKEITSTLLKRARERDNICIKDFTTMIDVLEDEKGCYGIVAVHDSEVFEIRASVTILACGGLGGIYKHTTNFRHITGDALAIALKHNIEIEHIDYIQIHPTTLYSEKAGRRFLISESVRGEGAILLNKDKKRFCNELQPRDVVTANIRKQMKEDDSPFVWLSMENIPEEEIRSHFPNIVQKCLEEGYDPTKECIPVVPAQHYFMGGIKVNHSGETGLKNLYAAGEISCNGVHGRNRLASNSLLESMVFAKRSADEIRERFEKNLFYSREELDAIGDIDKSKYKNLSEIKEEYKRIVLEEIDRVRSLKES